MCRRRCGCGLPAAGRGTVISSTLEDGTFYQMHTDVSISPIVVDSRKMDVDLRQKHRPRLASRHAAELPAAVPRSQPHLQRPVASQQVPAAVIPDLEVSEHRVPVDARVRAGGVDRRRVACFDRVRTTGMLAGVSEAAQGKHAEGKQKTLKTRQN